MDQTKIAEQAALLHNTLKALGIPVLEVDPTKAQVGPSLVRYRVRLGVGARLSSLRSHAEDIGRELSSPTMPIIDNIPGEPYVGFDLPRPDREIVSFQDAMTGLKKTGPLSMPIAFGVTPAGDHKTFDLVDLPHILVAGSTGSGKTVFLHAVVGSVAQCAVPQADIVIVDPKATDFTVYADSSKLGPGGRVITEPSDAVSMLQSLTAQELPRRTKKLHETRAANLRDYLAMGNTDLRPIVVVIDEYADLLMVLPKKERAALESDVTRLAQRARSVGIHLVLATQRPTVDVVTGQIKANLPIRVAFRLPQAVDSRVILDQLGAEALMGKGDMLLSMGDNLTRLQGYFLDTMMVRSFLDEPRPSVTKVVNAGPIAKQQARVLTLARPVSTIVEPQETEETEIVRVRRVLTADEVITVESEDEEKPWSIKAAEIIGGLIGALISLPYFFVREFYREFLASAKDNGPPEPTPPELEPRRRRSRRRSTPGQRHQR